MSPSHSPVELCATFSYKIKQVLALSIFLFVCSDLIEAATLAPASNALPTNGQVVSGNASIASSSTANSAVMSINQTSQRAVINWDTFNVGKNAQVNFNQPSASAVTLNRVTSATASMIDGAVRANGQVIFVNPNGITFGKGSEVNAAAVVATTLNIANQEFMDGKSSFKDDGTGVGNKAGKIINKGTIQTTNASGEDGFIALLAPEVRNNGYLLAQKGGSVVLGSGSQITLTIQGQSLIAIKVEESVYNGLISNKRIIEAPGGLVVLAASAANQLYAGVIKNTGRISADSLINNGGTIELVSKNLTQVGVVSANSQEGLGGQINLVGQEITLAKNSITTATGAIGGGQVNVGLASTRAAGGAQINTPTQAGIKANADQASSNNQLAQIVTIQENALVDASATQVGNGGTIAIWSQLQTTVAGILKSMGGVLFGNGGFIETSSKGVVSLAPSVSINTSAKNGNAGTWLLDPINLTIDSTAADIISSVLSSSNVTIAVTDASSSCPGVGVCTQNTLTSRSNLTVAADIMKTGSLYTKLTLSSSGDFNLNASITGQNLDVIISSSIAYLNVGTISASKVTIQAQTEIRNASLIMVSNYLLGGPAGSLGNAVELLAQAIYVTGRIVLNGGLPADPPYRLVGANINSIVDTNLDKIYSDRLIVIPATQAVGNEIYLTASQSISLSAVSQVIADGVDGGAIYLAAPTISNSLGSLIRANGSSGTGGIVGLKGNQITAAGNIYANGSTVGGSITLIANSGFLDLQNSRIQANGSTNGTINAQVTGVSSLLVTSGTSSAITGPALYSSNVLFLREAAITATVGSVSLGYEILSGDGSVVTLGSGAYANLAVAGTPTYVNGAGAITSAASAGSYSNLIVKGLFLAGPDSGKYLLALVPVTLTVNAATSQASIVQTAAAVQTSTLAATPPPPPPPVVIFAPPLPSLAPAKLEIAPVLAPMAPPSPPVAASTPPTVAGGEVSMSAPVRSAPLVAMADGTIQLTPPPPPGAAPPPANASPTQAPPPAAPPTANNRASSNKEARNSANNSETRKNGSAKDGAEKADAKDRTGKSTNGPSKYVSKYANGFKNTDKSAPKAVAAKAQTTNKPGANREGKYESRLRAMNNAPASVAIMKQNPFAGNISPFPPGVPHSDVTPIVLRGGDSLAQSYDDVPSIRNSGVANVGKSRNSENFHESLESVNLMSTLNLFIIH